MVLDRELTVLPCSLASPKRQAWDECLRKVVVEVAEAEAAVEVFAEVSYNCRSFSFTLIANTVVA